LFLTGPFTAAAHDANLSAEFFRTGSSFAQQISHNDADPFKGLINLSVTNTGNESWGDFHFRIFSIGQSVANVDFIVAAPHQPTSSQNPLTWVVDNTPVTGSTLDLFFYADPVSPGETAWFKVYTDNAKDKVPFGVMFYPTPVPIPTAFWLFATGLLGLVGFRRRRT
jgi:hypothetical protein